MLQNAVQLNRALKQHLVVIGQDLLLDSQLIDKKILLLFMLFPLLIFILLLIKKLQKLFKFLQEPFALNMLLIKQR
jgi:hypothetical protein